MAAQRYKMKNVGVDDVCPAFTSVMAKANS